MTGFGFLPVPHEFLPPFPPMHEADIRLLICPLVEHNPVPPGPGCSYADCDVCGKAVWVGPQHRALISEFDNLEYDYELRCENHAPDDTEEMPVYTMSAGNEASRLALLRGGRPRQPITVVTMSDVPAIMAANPGFNPLTRY